MEKNVFIFGVDMISSVHIDNKNKDILILGKGPTQWLNDSTASATKTYQFKENYPLYIGIISKDFTANNMKKQD